MLGRLYALKVDIMAYYVSNLVGGSWFLCGVRAKRHGVAPAASRQPIRMVLSLGKKTVTS